MGGPGPWINVFRQIDIPGNLLPEGGGTGRFVVSRYMTYPTGPPPQSIPTPPAIPDFVLGGTARQGVDYTATKQAPSVVLPPLGSSMIYVDGYEVLITTLADDIYENGGENVDFALIPNGQNISPIRGGYTNNETFVNYGISDTTPAPKPQVSIVAPDPTATEVLASTGLYRLMRNDVNLPQSLTVSYAFDPSVAKPATFGTDYSVASSVGSMSSSGTITFPAGQRFIEVKLIPVLDNDPETEEIARLKLVANTTYTIDPAASYADVTILDKPPALPFEVNVTRTCDCGCVSCPQVKPVEMTSIADATKAKFDQIKKEWRANTADAERWSCRGGTDFTSYYWAAEVMTSCWPVPRAVACLAA